MKTKVLFLCALFVTTLIVNPAFAEDEERKVKSFSEISLRIPGKLYLEQGDEQSGGVRCSLYSIYQLGEHSLSLPSSGQGSETHDSAEPNRPTLVHSWLKVSGCAMAVRFHW